MAGYLNALERGNSVPRPKEFYELNKVKYFAVLLQNLNCRDAWVIDTLLFYENMLFICIFDKLLSTLREARPFCERPSLSVRGLASL